MNGQGFAEGCAELFGGAGGLKFSKERPESILEGCGMIGGGCLRLIIEDCCQSLAV
jgi:hypothetical protein